MTVESFPGTKGIERQISYGWLEAHPFTEGNVYFWKLNKFLEKETFEQRWWIVKHKDTNRTLAQGLWTPNEAKNLLRNVKWENGSFKFSEENYKISYSLGEVIYSCKTSGVVFRALVRDKILIKEHLEELGEPSYFPGLNLLEGIVGTLYGDPLYTVKMRPILQEPGRVWFDLKTSI